ncbi:glutamine--fructose-6-phosphate transaminase (isomerizing) [Alphaproteobacteria bacterium]|nr:glutamine--fructose-6-phosphate transaminase (isomerizing) [Alphaproteobacteria bacterium]
MCGIIGILGKKNVVPSLVSGLKGLEYRGYDSSGVAILNQGNIQTCRSVGKIVELEKHLQRNPLKGMIGIAHTRWATHGEPSEKNAHPHTVENVSIVHNGIIENHQDLKRSLTEKGSVFQSDTDSEVIAHLANYFLKSGQTPQEAAVSTFDQLEGAFAVAMLFKGHDDLMICGRRGSPLVLGVGEGEMYVGSDALALSSLTQTLIYLEEGDWAVLHKESYEIYDQTNHPTERSQIESEIDHSKAHKGKYPHYMLKEIYEQPAVTKKIINAFLNQDKIDIQMPFNIDWPSVPSLTMIACGTSYYAALVAQNWIERYAKLPVRVEISSEFRYRQPPMPKGGVAFVISQSGETADTLAALRYAKSKGQKIISLVNVVESSIARESDHILDLMAGPEIGVASTKAFMAQLVILSCISLFIARKTGVLEDQNYKDLVQTLPKIPELLKGLLKREADLNPAAAFLKGKQSILYLGRGAHYPIAMEGALKMKELSYLHAEGAPSGELKHGPIALIDEKMPIVFLLPEDELQEKNKSNLEEVIARKGRVLLFGGHSCVQSFYDKIEYGFDMPDLRPFFLPILYTIPMQLLSYKVAVLERKDVDQPRNLAKSVTVE